jgi:hypothetical protein
LHHPGGTWIIAEPHDDLNMSQSKARVLLQLQGYFDRY